MRWRFGDFTLDVDTRQLRHGSRDVHLSPKAFDLLALLIDRRPNVVAKKALIDHLWSGTFVVEANLSNLVSEIRAALGDTGAEPAFIRTVHRRGYAFHGEVGDHGSGIVTCWIEWGGRRFPLGRGENVIGRHAGAAVMLDSSTVSRRHAALVVNPDATVLQDFGSHNGTFIGATRISEPTTLRDGDVIRIGDVMLTYRVRGEGTTETYANRAH